MDRNLTTIQAEYMDKYLEKSKDTFTEFMNKNPESKVLDFPGVGWIEYDIIDDIFWIHTAYSKLDHSFTKIIWDKMLKLAKDAECKSIQFTTARNPKAFERLFNAKIIEWKLEVNLTKEK